MLPEMSSFASPREYLLACLDARKAKNPRFSLRAWARQLGYKNPSLLADILAGRRHLSRPLATKIARSLDLSAAETTKLENSSKDEPKGAALQVNTIDLDQFRLIADWYHLVILEMILLRGFDSSTDFITKRMFQRISKAAAQTALERLIRLGLVEQNTKGVLTRNIKAKGLFVKSDTGDMAIRQHHEQMLQLASEALEKQPVDVREFMGSTVAIKMKDLPKIKNAMAALHRLFNGLSVSSSTGEAVYRLNTQLFRMDKEVSNESGK